MSATRTADARGKPKKTGVAAAITDLRETSTLLDDFVCRAYMALSAVEARHGALPKRVLAGLIACYGLRNHHDRTATVRNFRAAWLRVRNQKRAATKTMHQRASQKADYRTAIEQKVNPLDRNGTGWGSAMAVTETFNRSVDSSDSHHDGDSAMEADIERIFADHLATLPPMPKVRE